MPGYATAPALIMVGVYMMQEVVNIRFDRLEIAIPAFLMIVACRLPSISPRVLASVFISYTLVQVLMGRWRNVTPVMYIISAAFAVNFILR